MKMNNPFDTYSRGMTARERRIRSKWGLMLAITGIICLWLAFKTHNQEQFVDDAEQSNIVLRDSISKLNVKLDSLHDEAFNASTVNGRYELSLEFLKEINPKAAKDFEEFYDHQTE
jgi:hypothetical protein